MCQHLQRPYIVLVNPLTLPADGLVPRAVRMIKEHFPEAVVATDVALDPYSSMVRK